MTGPGALPATLAEASAADWAPEPCVLVVFGASGDLTRRMLLPALYARPGRSSRPWLRAGAGEALSLAGRGS